MKVLTYCVVICLLVGLTIPAMAQQKSGRSILKEGLLGAATGAIAADQSDGKAGKGALIGAGTNVVGGALLDVIMPDEQAATTTAPATMPVESATAQDWYQKGYQDGFKAGYTEGMKSAK